MIETSAYYRQEVDKLWPDVGSLAILLDKNFYIPPIEEVIQYFEESKISDIPTMGEMWECDKYSRAFAIEVHKKRLDMLLAGKLNDDQKAPISIACAAYGNMFRGMNMRHVVNLVLSQTGIWLFDLMPDARRYWQATAENDNVQILVV